MLDVVVVADADAAGQDHHVALRRRHGRAGAPAPQGRRRPHPGRRASHRRRWTRAISPGRLASRMLDGPAAVPATSSPVDMTPTRGRPIDAGGGRGRSRPTRRRAPRSAGSRRRRRRRRRRGRSRGHGCSHPSGTSLVAVTSPSTSVATSNGTTAAAPGGHPCAGHDADRLTGTELTVERAAGEGAPDHPPRRRRALAADGSRTRPSPRCRRPGAVRSATTSTARTRPSALVHSASSRSAPGPTCVEDPTPRRVGLDGDGARPTGHWPRVPSSPARRHEAIAGYSSVEVTGQRRLHAAAGVVGEHLGLAGLDGVEDEAGDVVGRRLGDVQAERSCRCP